ncbi:glycosyltransferase family 2 protein [Rubellimicrobium arenae]|uniref:glycosyltransferase family 2 protein n=1 Tax=Rubellimicrobium arenae TaxID=2817372 RepID=UPI001B3135B5|nr:glycosyltransferase family 2 protein [Rubellimicrobium arenae]
MTGDRRPEGPGPADRPAHDGPGDLDARQVAPVADDPPRRISDLQAGPDQPPTGAAAHHVVRLTSRLGGTARARATARKVQPWDDGPAAPPILEPSPGFDCDGLKGKASAVLGVLVPGLSGEDLDRAVADIAARQRASMDFKPVFLTDGTAFQPILQRGYTVERLPPGTGPAHLLRDRFERLRAKWGISGVLGAWSSERGFTALTPDEAVAAARRPASTTGPEQANVAPAPATLPRPPVVRPAFGMAVPLVPPRARPSGSGPLISYCIPVMDRGGDLRATLGANLDEHRAFGSLVEFVVLFFDDDRATQDWVRHEFRKDIRARRLRIVRLDRLDGWHFGKAKNAFRPLLRGQVYSSLDADNFVTAAETRQLLDVHAVHGDHFVFHHFSGEWGDGSSGRVSLPATLYRATGYNDRFLPRQFDEIDLILSALRADPSAALICHNLDRNLVTMSNRTRQFVRHEDLRNPFVHATPTPRRAPLNPRGAGYVQEDEVLRAMTEFNQALSFIGNTTSVEWRDRYVDLAYSARHRLVDLLPGPELARMIFDTTHGFPAPAGPDALQLFACVKDDGHFLPRFLDHYRRRGVTRFVLVDDHSAAPLRDTLHEPDVHVVTPKVGTFLTAKGLWLEAMMKLCLAPGDWALTVDADEFVDLPEGLPDFAALARRAEAEGKEWTSGLLIDMLPAAPASLEDLDRDPASFEDVLTHCCLAPTAPSPDYLAHPSIRWGFGDWAGLSWALDARFHAFGTFDSLRKVPFLRYRTGTHLNQGFHTVHYTDGTPPLGSNLWSGPLVLPIRHYKLSKLLTGAAREHLSLQVRTSGARQYHSRSAANIWRMLGPDAQQTDKLLALPAQPYPEGFLRALDRRHDGAGGTWRTQSKGAA